MMLRKSLDLVSAHEILHSTSGLPSNTETLNLISSLVLAENKLVRTSTITLASFNILAAITTVASILYDCYWESKRSNPNFKASKFCVTSIHPAETYPLVQSVGIIIQGIIFSGVQGVGLNSLFVDDCEAIAQILWPAIFIVPYIQLVFGLECAIRASKSLPFQARGKYNVTICCCIILLMLLVTWIPSHTFPEQDNCFASLLWFVSRYGVLGFTILFLLACSMLICALVIFCRLSVVKSIDQHQRIAASRIVHYIMVGVLSLIFILPFFFSLIKNGGNNKLSMMGAVVLNLSGLLSALLHLILRSNTSRTSFGTKIGGAWDRQRHDIRIFGPNELTFYNPLLDPVPGPIRVNTRLYRQSKNSSRNVGPIGIKIDTENFSEYAKPLSHSDELIGKKSTPECAKAISPASYSLFPSQEPLNHYSDPVPAYHITDLDLPRPIFARNSREIRNSSESSATVQIGLRLSHALTMNPSNEYDDGTFLLPATTYNGLNEVPPLPLLLQPTTYSGFQRPIISPTLKKPEATHVIYPNTDESWLRTPTTNLRTLNNSFHKSFSEYSTGSTVRDPSWISINSSPSNSVKSPGFRLSPAVYKPMEKVAFHPQSPGIVITMAESVEFIHKPSPSPDAKEPPPAQKVNWI